MSEKTRAELKEQIKIMNYNYQTIKEMHERGYQYSVGEVKRLQDELERTRKALDVAKDALKDNLSQANFTQMLDASRFHCIRTKCESALEQITVLEQKE